MSEQTFTEWYLAYRHELRIEFVRDHDALPTDQRQRENLWLAWLREKYQARRTAASPGDSS